MSTHVSPEKLKTTQSSNAPLSHNREKPAGGKQRLVSCLNSTLDQSLWAYATAASAAGVGLLALAQPAEAKIIFTPVHQKLVGKTTLDLNGDGVADFRFTNHLSTQCLGSHCGIHQTMVVFTYGNLQVYGLATGNQVWGQGTAASQLGPGVSVGSNGNFPGGKEMAGFAATDGQVGTTFGAWGAGGVLHQGYLGLKFVINGQTHFGWARIKVQIVGETIKAVLTGYAYETIAGKAIVTGQTHASNEVSNVMEPKVTPVKPSLGILAQGAPGLEAWRRRTTA